MLNKEECNEIKKIFTSYFEIGERIQRNLVLIPKFRNVEFQHFIFTNFRSKIIGRIESKEKFPNFFYVDYPDLIYPDHEVWMRCVYLEQVYDEEEEGNVYINLAWIDDPKFVELYMDSEASIEGYKRKHESEVREKYLKKLEARRREMEERAIQREKEEYERLRKKFEAMGTSVSPSSDHPST